MVAPTREAAERRVCGRAGSRLQMRRQARLEGCAPARGQARLQAVRTRLRACVRARLQAVRTRRRVRVQARLRARERAPPQAVGARLRAHARARLGAHVQARLQAAQARLQARVRARLEDRARAAQARAKPRLKPVRKRVARGSSASPSASSTSHSNPHASAHARPPAPSPTRTLPRLADSGKIPEFASGLRHADLHTAPVQSSARSQAELSAKPRRLVLIQFVSVGGMRAGPVPGERSVLFPRLIEGAH
jgi:hypothetical protein